MEEINMLDAIYDILSDLQETLHIRMQEYDTSFDIEGLNDLPDEDRIWLFNKVIKLFNSVWNEYDELDNEDLLVEYYQSCLGVENGS